MLDQIASETEPYSTPFHFYAQLSMISDAFLDLAEPWLRMLKDPAESDGAEAPLAGQLAQPLAGLEGELVELDADSVALDGAQQVSTEDIEAAEDAAMFGGLDTLAFYKSFRFVDRAPFGGEWGVFVLDAGIAGLASQFRTFTSDVERERLLELALMTLVRHEEYHFSVDAWSLSQEAIRQVGDDDGGAMKRYEPYRVKVAKPEHRDDDIEESLANHYAYHAVREQLGGEGNAVVSAVKSALQLGPGPYANFDFSATQRRLTEGQLAFGIMNGLPGSVARAAAGLLAGLDSEILFGPGIEPVPRDHPVIGALRCPRRLVRTTNYSRTVLPFQGPSHHEFLSFLTKYLGAAELRRSDHRFFKLDNGETIKLPNGHDHQIRGYELKNVLHKAGMTLSQYRSAREVTQQWRRSCPRSPIAPPLTAAS
jgi:hypothetical protein